MNWENQDLFGQTVWCLLLWLSLAWVSSLPLVSWKLEGICRPTWTSKVWTVHLLPKIVLPVQRTECLHLATEPHSQEIYLWHASSLSDLKENFRIQGPFPWYSLTLSQTIGHHVERATYCMWTANSWVRLFFAHSMIIPTSLRRGDKQVPPCLLR